MESEVHQVLGDIKIREICDCYRLDGDAKKIIDRILMKWDDLGGNIEEKIKAFERETGWYRWYSERRKLKRAFRDICELFATTKTGYSF